MSQEYEPVNQVEYLPIIARPLTILNALKAIGECAVGHMGSLAIGTIDHEEKVRIPVFFGLLEPRIVDPDEYKGFDKTRLSSSYGTRTIVYVKGT